MQELIVYRGKKEKINSKLKKIILNPTVNFGIKANKQIAEIGLITTCQMFVPESMNGKLIIYHQVLLGNIIAIN